jgi:hypothetical protein
MVLECNNTHYYSLGKTLEFKSVLEHGSGCEME